MQRQQQIQGSFAALKDDDIEWEMTDAENRQQKGRRTDNSDSQEQTTARALTATPKNKQQQIPTG
jgi:hypothetical protein